MTVGNGNGGDLVVHESGRSDQNEYVETSDMSAILSRVKRRAKGDGVTITKGETLEVLRSLAEEYQANIKDVQWALYEVLTPKKTSNHRWRGKPHIVLDVIPGAAPQFQRAETSSAHYGHRPQIRVAVMMSEGHIALFWNEAHIFEKFDPDFDYKSESAKDDSKRSRDDDDE